MDFDFAMLISVQIESPSELIYRAYREIFGYKIMQWLELNH